MSGWNTSFWASRSSTANAAADQGIHPLGLQKARQGTVAGTVGIHHLGRGHLAVLHLINFKLGCVAEVLEHLAVFVSNCENQKDTPPV